MKPPEHSSKPREAKAWHGIVPLALLYLWWIGFSLLMLGLGRVFAGAGLSLAVPLSTVCFIFLASLGTAHFLIRQEPHLRGRPWLRHLFLLFTLLLGVGLFLLTRRSGNPGTLLYLLGSANLLAFANLLGAWMVSPLKRPAELVPVCLVMAAADLFSILAGPTRDMVTDLTAFYEAGMEGTAPAAEFLLIKVAVPGMEHLLPVFGVADWIMVVFLAAAAVKFGMNDNLAGGALGTMVEKGRLSLYLSVPAAGLALAVLLAQGLGIFLPALPVVALVFLGFALFRFPAVRSLRHSDWALVLVVSGAMAALAAIRF
jgi:hypothetical protein